MKLNETNAKYAVVRTAFHGGGTISFHNSLDAALHSKRKNTFEDCCCGCCAIIPITEEAQDEIGPDEMGSYTKLYKEIPYYEANGEHYSTICK